MHEKTGIVELLQYYQTMVQQWNPACGIWTRIWSNKTKWHKNNCQGHKKVTKQR